MVSETLAGAAGDRFRAPVLEDLCPSSCRVEAAPATTTKMARRTKFFQHRVVLFRFTSGDGAHTSTGVPTPIEVTRDGILFLGSGSCGVLGEVRISILTRVEPAPGAMQRTGTNHAPGN